VTQQKATRLGGFRFAADSLIRLLFSWLRGLGNENSTNRRCPALILRCRSLSISRQVAFYLGKLVLAG
jgi:hypothetical protein